MTGDRTGSVRVGLVGAGLLASLFIVTAVLASVSAGRGPAGSAVARPAFPADAGPVWLWLSVTEVPPGAELVASLQNPTGVESTFGVAATIDQWDGTAWQPHRFVAVCLDFWACTGRPQPLDGDHAVPSIGLFAGSQRTGPIERFSTAGLDPGWYRIRQQGSHNQTATGIFHVTAGAPTPAPLPATGQQALSLDPFLIRTGPTTVIVRPLVPNVTNMAEQAAALAGQGDRATVEHWTGTGWEHSADLDLRPDPIDPIRIARLADLPSLAPGAYRLVRHGTHSTTGPFWVTNHAGPIATTDLRTVDWSNVRYPLDCPHSDRPPFQLHQVVYATPAPERTVAVVAVWCHAEEGPGFPPRTIYVFDTPPRLGTVRPIQTISDGLSRTTGPVFAAGDSLTLSGVTFPPGASHCCPDGIFTSRWTWTGDRYISADPQPTTPTG